MARILIGNVRDMETLQKWFAPAGYGLGKSKGRGVTNCNDAVDNGWYVVQSGSANAPWSSGSWMFVESFSDTYKIQRIGTESRGGLTCQRIMDGGVWGAWEYLNPPMVPGVEYRTTERWNGKPVYIKAVNLGNLPAQANTSVLVDNSVFGKGVTDIVDYGGSLRKGTDWVGSLPYFSVGVQVYAVVSSAGIGVWANSGDFSDRSATVWVKYTRD
jgi:hypothetical protein